VTLAGQEVRVALLTAGDFGNAAMQSRTLAFPKTRPLSRLRKMLFDSGGKPVKVNTSVLIPNVPTHIAR
jgi:hypothetical protein